MNYKNFTEDKIIFLTNAFFYLNFSNLLNYVSSTIITYIVFIIIQLLAYLFVIHLILVAFLKKQQLFQVLKSQPIEFLNIFFQIIVTLYYWTLFVPCMEIFSNFLDCDWYSYLPNFEQNCPDSTVSLKILSIFGIMIFFICGLFIIWLYRTYNFLDKSLLKKKFTFILLIIYLCKVFLVCLWPVFKNIKILIFIILHMIGIFSLYDYIMNFPITNTILSRFYISVILSFEVLCIIFSLDCYTNIFEENDLFYIIMIVLILTIKVALKLFQKLYYRILIQNFSNFQYLGFSLEELHRLYDNRFNSDDDLFLFCGMLKFHIRTCKIRDCVLSDKKMLKFEKMNVIEKEKLINQFISEMFIRNVRQAFQNNQKNNKNYDSILLKYCSFLIDHNNNSIKSYYEIQHILSLNTKKSFYFQSISLNLLKLIESLIKIYEYESKKNNESTLNQKEIDLQSFFEILKDKNIMKTQIIKIFELKIEFWEQYKTGLHSYNQLIRNINKLMMPVTEYAKLIELKLKIYKNSQKRIFALKFKILFTCFILNTVNECMKVEDELEKLKKKELTLEKNIINCNSFFYGNVVTLQASFLKAEGVILESSKTIKLANFFNYSSEEIKSVKNIITFMPDIIARNHSRFINNYMNRARSKKDKEDIFIPTYGLTKTGFIFPIKKYTGMNFDLRYNVIMHTALLDLGQQNDRIILFDEKGYFQGNSEEIYKTFFDKNEKVTQKHLSLFNLYNFMPELEKIVEKNGLFKDKSVSHIINQSAPFFIPEDFTDILEVLTMKMKEENESKSHKSYISGRSMKSEQTKKSSNHSQLNISKNSRFMNKFFKTKTVQSKSFYERQTLEKKLQGEPELSNYDLMKELINPENSEKYYIHFNILCHRYKLSKTQDLMLAVMQINKVTKSMKLLKAIVEDEPKEEDIETNSNFLPPSTFKESEGIKSSFVNIPPENKFIFNEYKNEKLTTENNKLLTTENDLEEEKGITINELISNRNQVLKPPSPLKDERRPFNPSKQNMFITSAFQTIPSKHTLSLIEKKEETKQKNHHSNTESNNIITLSSAHKVKLNEVTSQHSSINSVKKTFSIFNIIKMIQLHIPPSLRNFTCSQFIELLVILSYCVIIYLLNVQYIDKYYLPLQTSISSISQIYNAYAVSSLVLVRYELQKLNYANKVSGTNAVLYEKIFSLVFNESFEEMKNLVQNERSQATVFEYQYFLKTAKINATGMNFADIREQDYLDFLDQITGIINTIINIPFENLQINLIEYLPVNFDQFLKIYIDISEKINTEFYDSNHNIINTIEIIMIFLIFFTFILKIVETLFILSFLRQMIRIINIFLRVNQHEVYNELLFTKEILQSLKDPNESYLNMMCTEKMVNRKSIKLGEEDISLTSNITRNNDASKKKKKNPKKNFKKFSFHHMKSLSHWPLINYIVISFLILFMYIFFNYYFASILTQNIDNLIGISIFFENLYTLPTTTIMLNRIIVREKVITNSMYNYPNPEQREKNLYNELKLDINELYNVSKSTPTYSLNADALKSDILKLLIYGNICDALLLKKLIENDEKNLCDQTLNVAFTKGILNVISELLNSLNSDDYVCQPISFTDQNARATQKQQIFDIFATNLAMDRIMTEFFLNKALMLFNKEIQSYYGNMMLQEMNVLKIVVLTTGVSLLLVFCCFLCFAHYFLQQMFRNMTMVLNLIPYDKLNNDEQTLFLIKKYWRN